MKLFNKAKLLVKFALTDIECGMHSGFKPCCIFCYAILDNLSYLNKGKFYDRRRCFNRFIERCRQKQFGYIPCPFCLFGEPVEVMPCENSKHKFRYRSSYKDLSSLYENLHLIDTIFNFLLNENKF